MTARLAQNACARGGCQKTLHRVLERVFAFSYSPPHFVSPARYVGTLIREAMACRP